MKLLKVLMIMSVCLVLNIPSAYAQSRIKDMVRIEGIRDNALIGYGLVVGLNGTGDKLNSSVFTERGLVDFLNKLGINTQGTSLKTKNVAAVIVTANLPPFSRQGNRIDVNVSALGDAKSLHGGMLLATPMLGADGNVYAVAQGSISIGGHDPSGNNDSAVQRGVPTAGYVSSGGIIEKEIDFALSDLENIRLSLNNPDITTAHLMAEEINRLVESNLAAALDPGTILLSLNESPYTNVLELLSEVEQIEVETDQPAKIIIDEATGTVVMGENVRINTVAIAQGNLVVRVTEDRPLSIEDDSVIPVTNIATNRGADNKLVLMGRGASLRELIGGLNALGVSPRDLITILQTIKASGALQASIETR